MPNTAPWWLPQDWLVVVLSILGGVVLTQFWKLHCRYRFGNKPRRYVIAFMSVVFTGALLTAFGWLDDQPIKQAIRTGMLWGLPSPILWLVIQWAIRRHAPGLADAIGECRRTHRADGERWTEEQRQAYRRGLFEDTVQIEDGVKQVKDAKKKLNGQGGFASVTLVAGVVMAGAIAGLSWLLLTAHEQLGVERTARALATERIAALEAEVAARDASLAERDRLHDQSARRLSATRTRLQEAEHAAPETVAALDCRVPESVADVLRQRRGGGQPDTASAGDTAARHPAPGAQPGDDA